MGEMTHTGQGISGYAGRRVRGSDLRVRLDPSAAEKLKCWALVFSSGKWGDRGQPCGPGWVDRRRCGRKCFVREL